MSATALQFEESTHTYSVGGVIIPSVTQVLAACGLTDFSRVDPVTLERKRQLGTEVHKACQYIDENDFDAATLTGSVIEPYVNAYLRFKADAGFTPCLIEKRGMHRVNGMAFGYCVDRAGTLGRDKAVIDLKCGCDEALSWRLQLAAYDLALREPVDCRSKRLAVQLRNDGTYRLFPYSDPNDERAFLWALGLATWKQNAERRQ